MTQPVIDHFLSAHSAFGWLGLPRLREIAAATGRRIRHVPIPLDPVLEAVGSPGFRVRSEKHVAYFFGREIARWAELRGRPWDGRMPTHHRADYLRANRCLIAADLAGADATPLAEAFLAAHWQRDADLSDDATLTRLIAEAGLSPAEILAAADGPEAHARHDANRDEAIARSVFGSPTYFVDGDMFYGQDRLDLVARACERPFAPTPAG